MVQQRNNLFVQTPSHYSNNYSNSCSRPVSPSLCIPIRLEWNNGEVVTETSTEYRDVNDDSDFVDFGQSTSTPTSSRRSATVSAPKCETSSSEEDESDSSFEAEALKAHNVYRAKHGVSPLKLDKKLCEYAKEWADTLAKLDKFEHRPDQTYGENIYCTWSTDSKAKCSGSRPVESWYSEVTKYNFEKPSGNSMGAGHFTQVVWKDSRHFGIAKSRSSSGKILVVAAYDPPGNFIGQYKDNVLKGN